MPISSRGSAMLLTQEEELLLMRHVHLVSERIKSDKRLTEDNLRIIKELFPELFTILTRISPEYTFEIFEKYKDHQFFIRDIAVLLTPKGRELVAIELQMIREYAERTRPADQGK
jgi:hypothetical protein